MSRQEVIQVGINGFGRIGRAVFKQLLQREDFRVVGVNDLNNIEDLAYLLKYDSVHGWYSPKVSCEKSTIQVDGLSNCLTVPRKTPSGERTVR